MSWDIFSKSKIQYFLQKLKDKFVQKETGKGLSTNDYTTTDKNKVSKIDTTTTSISGNPISIPNLKSNQLAKNPIITLEPIQSGSGTPSPSNIRAISGYDKVEALSEGANRWDETWEVGGLIWNTGAETSATDRIRTDFIPMIDGGTYYVYKASTINTSSIGVVFYDKNKERVGANSSITANSTLEMPSGTAYARFVFIGITTYSSGISINYPATCTTYQPYHKTTDLSESLGQTVYGGTYEPRTGLFTVTHKVIDMGDLNYVYGGGRFNSTTAISDVGGNVSWYYADVIFSMYRNSGDSSDATAFIYSNVGTASDKVLYVYDSRYTDTTAFKTAVTGQKICYKLATPFTIQLTPHEIALSQGYNYISTNGTSISLAYHNGELASLADVSQLGETVNEISQAFQDGCDKIMGAVAAKGVTPASNSPDDISKAIRSLVTYEQPIEFDYRCGYITNGVWYYENPTDTLSDIYEVKNGHTYYMFFGNVTGTRFRAITTTTDIRTVTSGTITGDQTIKNSSNPGALSYVTFTSTVDGYFIVCKDNVGKTGITTYMQDRTTM